MKCFSCDNLLDGMPIKVIDFKANNPFVDDIYHFEDGFKCTWNGFESFDVEDLPKQGCRCTGGE